MLASYRDMKLTPISTSGSSDPVRGALVRSAAYFAIMLAVLSVPNESTITSWYFLSQDAVVGAAMLLLFVAAVRWSPTVGLPQKGPSSVAASAIATVLALLLWWGTHAVMYDYPLTRDEAMVAFDGYSYGRGLLSHALPAEWCGFATALIPAFLLELPGHVLMVSSYGPVNAALRAGFGHIADPALMNPLLAGAGLVLTWHLARRLFSDCAGAQWVVLACYVLSSQVAVNAMTHYAMTAHLVLNLAWLALFLRDRPWSHVAAIVIGVLAIGLHQVIFHPLFAGPFTLVLLAKRRYRVFAAYALVYVAALALWMSWPNIIVIASGVAIDSAPEAGAGFFAERVLPLILERDPRTALLMFYNLVRAMTWNLALALPLILLALPAVRRRDGMALPLVCGVALTLLTMAFLLPYQGHGWGYRYLHPVLGSVFLLAGYGYRELANIDRPRAEGLAVMFAAVSLPLMAWLLLTTSSFVRPQAKLTEYIQQQNVDFAIVDAEFPYYAVDQVRNLPDLTNRPLVFASEKLTPSQMRTLCERGTVMLIGRREFQAIGFVKFASTDSPLFTRRVRPIAGNDCLVAPSV